MPKLNFVVLLLSLALASGASAAPQQADLKRAPKPTPEQIAEKRAQAEQVYKLDDVGNREEKLKRARKLFADAGNTSVFKETDTAARFAVTMLAFELATKAGDLALVEEISTALDSWFLDIEPPELRAQAIIEMAGSVRKSESGELLKAGVELIESYLAAEAPLRPADLIESLARPMKIYGSRKLKARFEATKRALDELREFSTARFALKSKPNDQDANQVVGRYIAFIRGDLEGGLPLLAKGPKGALTDCAKADIASPKKAPAQRALGTQWREWAIAQGGRSRVGALKRAAHWFRVSLEGLDALSKVEAMGWLEEIEEETAHSQTESVAEGGSPSGPSARPSSDRTRGGDDETQTEAAIRRALGWLGQHQHESGYWDSDGFFSLDEERDRSDRRDVGDPNSDVGITGLALLAFLGDGNTTQRGPEREIVEKGIEWLLNDQDRETGLFGEEIGQHFLYDHAIATLAVCRVYAADPTRALESSAQKAIEYIEEARNPYGAWRYAVPPDGDSDTSVTAWMILAMKSAEQASLKVNRDAYAAAIEFLDEMTDEGTGRVGYTERGSSSSRVPGKNQNQYPTDIGEALTAAGLRSRLLLGQRSGGNSVLKEHAELLLRRLPTWDQEEGGCDMYYWYHGTSAMHQLGGKYWKLWRKALKPTLLESQRTSGGEAYRGSWDPVGPWGYAGGRIYSTALMAMCLQATTR